MTLLLKRDLILVRKEVRDLLAKLEKSQSEKEHIQKQADKEASIIHIQRCVSL